MKEILAPVPVALLIDAETGQVLAERRSNARFMPASVTKVMTLYRAFSLLEQGEMSIYTPILMRDQSHKEWYHKGSSLFIRKGQTVPLDMILSGIASVSANDASIALAEQSAGSVEAWAAGMNQSAREIGMKDSHFATPNGWPDGGKTFTTAHDLARLAKVMIRDYGGLYTRYVGKPGLTFNGITQRNHDPISGVVDGADGIKTGFTNEAGFTFLGSARRGSTRLIMVVAGVQKSKVRDVAARALIEWGFNHFQRPIYYNRGEFVANAHVPSAPGGNIRLIAVHDIRLAFPKGATPKANFTVRYRDNMVAPIKPGSVVAYLDANIDAKTTLSFPLTVKDKVENVGFLETLTNRVKGWFA